MLFHETEKIPENQKGQVPRFWKGGEENCQDWKENVNWKLYKSVSSADYIYTLARGGKIYLLKRKL